MIYIHLAIHVVLVLLLPPLLLGVINKTKAAFAGRVGPLTLFLFLTEQQHETPISYPEEEVDVG